MSDRFFVLHDTGEARFQKTDGTISLVIDGQRGEIRIKDWSIAVPDYVFDPGYSLPTLESLQAFVNAHHHLPDVPPAEQIAKDGLGAGQASDSRGVRLAKILLDRNRIAQMWCDLETAGVGRL